MQNLVGMGRILEKFSWNASATGGTRQNRMQRSRNKGRKQTRVLPECIHNPEECAVSYAENIYREMMS